MSLSLQIRLITPPTLTLIILNITKTLTNKLNQINFIFGVSTFKVCVLKFILSSSPGSGTPLFPVAVLILILDVVYGTGREKINYIQKTSAFLDSL